MAAPPDPAVLIDDLVGEFLLRLPPEDPAVLARAAVMNQQWYRVVTSPVFCRRFREFHGSPLLLGYIANIQRSIRFVPTSSFRPRHADDTDRGGDVRAVHSSHGRVLLHRSPGKKEKDLGVFLSVWNPITDELRDLPVLPLRVTPGPLIFSNWDAVVICTVGDGCNHIHCHFKVVCVGRSQRRDFSCFYSSEADSWSDPIFASGAVGHTSCLIMGSCVHIGSALYFRTGFENHIVQYDMLTNQMSNISRVGMEGMVNDDVLIATEDGRLGVAMTSNSTLHLWIREHGRWEERRVIELRTLLPDDALSDTSLFPPEAFAHKPWVAGFAEIGASVIFLKTRVGYFAVDLNSGRSKNIGECLGWGSIIPYVSFCTPAPRAVSTVQGPGAGVVRSLQTKVQELAYQMNKKLKLQVHGLLNQEGNH